jgi:hypothetical protein
MISFTFSFFLCLSFPAYKTSWLGESCISPADMLIYVVGLLNSVCISFFSTGIDQRI